MRIVRNENTETISFELYPESNTDRLRLEELGLRDYVYSSSLPELNTRVGNVKMVVFNEMGMPELHQERIVLIYVKEEKE